MADVMVPTWTTGDRLIKARKLAGLKQSEMADYLGMSRAAVSSWENDETPIKLGMLRSWLARCNETSVIPITYEWMTDNMAQICFDGLSSPIDQPLLLDGDLQPLFDFAPLADVLPLRRAS